MILINKQFVTNQPLSGYKQKVVDFLLGWEVNDVFEVKTSGSTGEPKTILLKKKQFLASIQQTKNAFELSKDNLFFCSLSVDYIAGKLQLLRAYELGATALILEPASNPFEQLTADDKNLLKQFSDKVFYAFVPLQLTEIYKNPEDFSNLNAAQAILIGGAGVSVTQLDIIRTINSPVWATYGMTETVTHLAIRRLNGDNEELAFRLLSGIEIDLTTENCLKVKGQTTDNQWVETNDVVELVENDSFKLIGRKDNIINSGGVKIQLEKVENEIEKLLDKSYLVNRFFCWGIADEVFGQKLVLILETPTASFKEELQLKLKEALSKYELPKELICLKEFVNLPSGKINKIKTIDAAFSTLL